MTDQKQITNLRSYFTFAIAALKFVYSFKEKTTPHEKALLRLFRKAKIELEKPEPDLAVVTSVLDECAKRAEKEKAKRFAKFPKGGVVVAEVGDEYFIK